MKNQEKIGQIWNGRQPKKTENMSTKNLTASTKRAKAPVSTSRANILPAANILQNITRPRDIALRIRNITRQVPSMALRVPNITHQVLNTTPQNITLQDLPQNTVVAKTDILARRAGIPVRVRNILHLKTSTGAARPHRRREAGMIPAIVTSRRNPRNKFESNPPPFPLCVLNVR